MFVAVPVAVPVVVSVAVWVLALLPSAAQTGYYNLYWVVLATCGFEAEEIRF